MATTGKIEVIHQDLVQSLQNFFRSVLMRSDIEAILVPQHLPAKPVVMPTLVTDPEKLEGADPFAPAFPLNASKIVSRLTRKKQGKKVAAVLRPCEIRAFVELVKLKQGRTEELVLIGVDCLGAFSNSDYARWAKDPGASTASFLDNAFSEGSAAKPVVEISEACKSCEHPVAEGADMMIEIYGIDVREHLIAKALTTAGESLLKSLELPPVQEPASRKEAVDELVAKRVQYRDRMFAQTVEAVSDAEKLTLYLSNCVNCYNCRVACPVCYCRECVFVTDVFDHEPAQYLKWADRKGILKMPTDTLFYHVTRLAHMSTACVGCGQCSNACPNDIPVMQLFRTVAYRTQKAFDYEAGRSLGEPPPLSVFRENEFLEVTGGKN
jgi:formate dehydrogenase subunit beta